VGASKKLRDMILAPHIPTVLVAPLRPAWLICIDDLETAPAELGESSRLARARHPRHENLRHAQRERPTLRPIHFRHSHTMATAANAREGEVAISP
jgi:hypothetical protein